MLKLAIKFIFGILIIPAAVGITIAFYRNIMLVQELAKSMNLFVWGIASYTALHILFYKPTFLYVFGHEAVHAGVAWVMGAKVKSFNATKEGGSVTTDKTNTFIELGPYFIPIYAIIIAIIYFIVASSYSINGSVFVFLIGFALAFHIIMTIEVMKMRQQDIMKSGQFFSVILIYALNIVVMALIFSLLFPQFSAKKFFVDTWSTSKVVYAVIVRQLFS